jgi:hypothetical protein
MILYLIFFSFSRFNCVTWPPHLRRGCYFKVGGKRSKQRGIQPLALFDLDVKIFPDKKTGDKISPGQPARASKNFPSQRKRAVPNPSGAARNI